MPKENKKCKKCKGEKVYEESTIIPIKIHHEIRHEEEIILVGKSDEMPGYQAGDIHARILIAGHQSLNR